MRLLTFAFGLALAVTGCTTTAYDPGSGGSGGTGGGGSAGSGGGSGSGGSGGGGGGSSTGGVGSDKSGTLSADETWSGAITITGDVTVAAGVTLTIADGTLIQVAAGKALLVAGTLLIQGTSATGVSFTPNPTPGTWDGIQVQMGGAATISYTTLNYPTTGLSCAAGVATCALDHSKVLNYGSVGITLMGPATIDHVTVDTGGSGGLLVQGGASDTVTITDSIFHHTGGDAVIADAGNMTLSYSHIYGDMVGGNAGVHCATHIATSGLIMADHNILEDANYGLMASNMTATSKINYNNFLNYGSGSTGGAYSPSTGALITAGVDLTNNYWNGQAPPTGTGTTLTTTMYQTTQVPGCGPRP
ncbi:MAG TPA: right-handed parallel beta-helix repeat-containing protein [Polyangia bacterium]